MSTTKKHREFVSEPMGDKEVTAIAGIGETYGENLSEQGIDKASQLLGYYLIDDGNEEEFTSRLQETAGSNKHYAASTYNCLNEWAEQHI